MEAENLCTIQWGSHGTSQEFGGTARISVVSAKSRSRLELAGLNEAKSSELTIRENQDEQRPSEINGNCIRKCRYIEK